MILTAQQKQAMIMIEKFIADKDSQVFILKGYAGTGKTTLIRSIADYLSTQSLHIQLMAPTGRAAKILRSKLPNYGASTIHRGIYNFSHLIVEESEGTLKYIFPLKDNHERCIYIIDEASMISSRESKNELFQFGTGVLIKDLLSYAKRYNILLCGKTSSKELNSCINRLNRLETTVTRPFFLEVLRLYDENQINLNEVAEAFSITESYLFRRTICDLPTNALNKIFLLLNREIMRYDGTDSNYIEKLKFALLSKKDRARFPNDDDFSLMFTEKPIYQMNSKNKIYILERLENFGTLEDKDIYRHYDEGEYSIEHIMPQHLTPAWIKELGDSYEEIHDTWLHRIANLTLTAYNSKYSNSTFVEKKTMKNGFEDSGIRLNTYVSKKDKWTLAELRDRNDYLLKRALNIWAFQPNLQPVVQFLYIQI